MPKECPADCQQDRDFFHKSIDILFARSIPTWARAILIALIGTLFMFVAACWAYSAVTYATKEEVKNDIQVVQQRIDRGFGTVIQKLNEVLEK